MTEPIQLRGPQADLTEKGGDHVPQPRRASDRPSPRRRQADQMGRAVRPRHAAVGCPRPPVAGFSRGPAGLSPGQRVLDVASGTGHLSVELARRVRPGGSVDGIDAAAEMTARAQATARGLGLPVTFQTAAAQRLPFPDAAFDAATCTLGLHHIAPADRQQAVNEMQRVLRSGGRLLIPDGQPPKPVFDPCCRGCCSVTPSLNGPSTRPRSYCVQPDSSR